MAITLNDPFLFAMYSIEVFLDFELFALFLLRWKPKKTRHVAVLGLAYLCFGIARLLLMFWDYTEPRYTTATAGYYIVAAFFAFVAMAVFMHAAESLIRKTRHVATIGFLTLACIVLLFPPSMYVQVKLVYYIFSPVLILFVIGFLFYLMATTTGRIRKKFFVVFLGLALYGAGYALSADIFPISDALSESVVLVGLAMTALGFIEIPMLEEIHWHDYLLHIFTFHIDTSVCIHEEKLEKSGMDENVSGDLFSSGVTGVIGIIKEMIRSEKRLRVLDHEDKKILLEYGKHVTVALITRKDLDILHEKLRVFISRVETELQKQLESWRGEVSRFAPQMKAITMDVFRTIVDKNWWRVDPRSMARQVVAFVKGLLPERPIAREHEPEGNKIDLPRDPGEVRQSGGTPAAPTLTTHVPPEEDPWPAPARSKGKEKPPATLPEASPVERAPLVEHRVASASITKPAAAGEQVHAASSTVSNGQDHAPVSDQPKSELDIQGKTTGITSTTTKRAKPVKPAKQVAVRKKK